MKNWRMWILAALLLAALCAGASAREMAVDGGWTDRVAIDGENQVYYYQITLPTEGRLQVMLQSWIDGVNYKLWDEQISKCYDDTNIWGGSVNEPKSEAVSDLYLPAGVYCAEVIQVNGQTGEFRLRAELTPGECNETEPNDPVPQATPILAGRVYRGMLWREDDYDYYAFTLESKQTVKLIARAYMDSLKVGLRDGDELYAVDADGKEIGDQNLWGGNSGEPATFVLERTLLPGDYYILINRLNGRDGIYEFSLDGELRPVAIQPPEPAPEDAEPGQETKDWFCPNCGVKNSGNFCYNCGEKNPRN